jgi:hypothetical protein
MSSGAMTATASSSRAVEVAARRAVPDLPVRDHLPDVQRRGVPELGPVTHHGVDVQDRLLADEGARADGDGAGLDDTGSCAVAVEVAVLADHGAGPDA